MAGANLAVKNIQNYRWPEHFIDDRSMAGVFHKWTEHSVKWLGNLERILLRRSCEHKSIKRMIKSNSEKAVLNSYTLHSFSELPTQIGKKITRRIENPQHQYQIT